MSMILRTSKICTRFIRSHHGVTNVNSYTKAKQYQNNGEDRKAATEYALLAFEELLEADFESTRQTRVAIGLFLRSISCDMKAENPTRVEHIQTIIEQVIKEMGRQRIMEDEAEERCVRGLLEEWLGDSYLMIGSKQAVTHYEMAKNLYEDVDPKTRMGWGMEDEFIYSHSAVEEFINENGYEFPEEIAIDTEFLDRVEFKIQLLIS